MLRDSLVVDAALGDEVVLEVSTDPVALLGARLIKLRVDLHQLRELVLDVAHSQMLHFLLLPFLVCAEAHVDVDARAPGFQIEDLQRDGGPCLYAFSPSVITMLPVFSHRCTRGITQMWCVWKLL